MMTELELTLSEALSFAKVAEMPAELEEGRTDWVKALVLVRKYNGRENYALAINEGGAMPSVVKDFGSSCGIQSVLRIYPYAFLAEKYRPNLRNKDEIVTYLVGHGEDEEAMRQLLSSTTKAGKDKAEATKEKDKAKVKALVNKYAMADETARKASDEAAFAVAHHDDTLPELPKEREE